MKEKFYTILTNAGKAAIANASALGAKVDFKTMALGDGNGNYYNPTEQQTQLVNQVYTSQINHVQIDDNNPNWITLTMVLAGNVGGFTVREVGAFDTAGNLLVIGKYPETYKPLLEDGSAKDLTINMILEVSNTSVVTLKIDPSVILATKAELDVLRQQLIDYEDELESHKADYANFKNNIEAIRYVDEKIELKIDGEWIEFKSKDGYPVGNISNIKVEEDDGTLRVSWQDPPDVFIEDSEGNPIKIATWAGTKLVINDTTFPVNETNGDLLINSMVRDGYKDEGFLIKGLENEKTYYIGLFPYTEDGAITIDSANRVSATPTEIDPNSWKGIQTIVRKGLANDHFTVGDQIVSGYDGEEIIWEVIGIDVDVPADPELTHSMTLQTKDCLHDIQFDAPEPSNPDTNRRSNGNNRYAHSAVKQWLNSDESTFIWKSQHQYDVKPSANPELYNGAGFLNRLDPELVGVLGTVNKKVAKNTVTDGGGQEEIADKVFLLSPKEVGFTPSEMNNDGDYTGEFVYPFYDGKGNTNRIKNLKTSPRNWWLRSPTVSNSHNVRGVHTSGSLSHTTARYSYGLSPACTIV